MTETESGNRRIARNTVVLYVRTIFTLLVSLYTSRITLDVLGVSDFGIYSVVGGLVSMFSVMSSSLCNSISRFLTFGLGKGDEKKLHSIFTTSVNIQILMALFVFIVGALVGGWFLNNKMSIPEGRLFAANWVLFLSLCSFSIGLISVPYNSCIIAHEKMDAFAYISILECVLKLGIVYLLYIFPFDKLILCSALFVLLSLVIRFIYGFYCKIHFKECKYEFNIDKSLLKEMGSFAGWNFFGNTSYLLNTEGVNMLMNVFFGVVVNAARGVAVQVQNAILQFVNNFTTAINPQITILYAEGNYERLFSLICKGAKYSYFLLLLFTIPVFVESDKILELWLGKVPEYSSIFLKLILIGSYMTIIGNTSFTAIMATGNIKSYQIWITIVGCLVFPLTWVFYKLGYEVTITYYIYICVYFILDFIRLYYLKVLIGFPPFLFVKDVFLRIALVSIPAFLVPYIFISFFEPSLLRLFLTTFISITVNVFSIYFFGLEHSERVFVNDKLKKVYNHVF